MVPEPHAAVPFTIRADSRLIVSDDDSAHYCSCLRRLFCLRLLLSQLAMERDPRLGAPSTLQALLASLTRMQQAMQLITDRDMTTREQLYWLTFNATVRVFALCEVGASVAVVSCLCVC